MTSLTRARTRQELAQLAETFESQPPEALLRWAFAAFGEEITIATSFGGPSGMVLLDMALQLKPDVSVFYLDTGLLFPETYELVDVVA